MGLINTGKLAFKYDASVDSERWVRMNSNPGPAITIINDEQTKQGVVAGHLSALVSGRQDVNVHAYKCPIPNDFIILISKILFGL